MRLLSKFALALQLGSTAALSRRDAPLQSEFVNKRTLLPRRFVVEVAQGVNVDDLSAKFQAAGATVLKTFKSDIFTGLSIEADGHSTESLQGLGDVHQAWPVAKIRLHQIAESGSFSDDATAADYSVHASTGVEELHAAGNYGKGALVGIVDTGIDYLHPALGGGIGPGYKVAGGYDLVGDVGWPASGDKVPDTDPFDQNGHGTHVAGILAGKTDWFIGVAPEATIMSYKVFSNGTDPSTDDATLVDAFLRAYNDGVDIITASIGAGGGWSDGPWATVASRLVDQGVVVTLSAGNDGYNGPFFAGTGSSGKNVIAVASIDPIVNAVTPFAATFTLAGVSNVTNVGYQPAETTQWNLTEDLPIIPISVNMTDDAQACSTLPDTTPSLNGSIALIRGGGCTFKQKQTYAAQFGATRILFYDDDTPKGSLVAVDSSVPVGVIELRAGVAMVNTIVEGGSVTANFAIPKDPNWRVSAYNAAGGIPSDYTSWGGTNDLGIKPDIAAPGRDIFSTYLDGTYKTLSGTSMACPYIAGVAALYIGKYGGRTVHGTTFAKELAKRIISSGASLPWQTQQPEGVPVDYGFWAPVPQVGTGLVNASKVLSYDTSLSFNQFALNDTANFSGTQSVDVTNNGAEAITYTFALQPAAGFNMKSNFSTSFLGYLGEMEPISIIPSVTFPQGTFTVAPGETRSAQITFSLPNDIDPSGLPIYSGKVLILGSNGEELSVPYLGAAFDLVGYLRGNLFTNGTPRQLAGTDSEDIDLYHSYSFDLRVRVRSYPQVLTRYRWGTQQVRWDLFEAGWSESQWVYPPVVGENGYVGAATSFADSANYATFIPAIMDKEDIIPFPVTYLPRTDSYTGVTMPFWWFGKLVNGTYIAPGNYTMRFAALLPLSDPGKSDSWDIWSTPEITILSYTP